MKRFISWLLAVALLLALAMPVAMAADERTSGAFTYRIKGNGTVIITDFDYTGFPDASSYISEDGFSSYGFKYSYVYGNNNAGNAKDIYIPRMLDGYTVTEIGEQAFSIYLFDEKGFVSSYADDFSVEPQIGSIVIPDTITSIGDKAFFGAKLATKVINIPSSVQHIGAGAFSCISGVEQFVVDSQNPVYATIDGVLFNKKEKALIAFPLEKTGSYTVPNGITAISDYACFKVSSQIVFPETLTRIGKHSFAHATISTSFSDRTNFPKASLVLPPSVSQIGIGSFYSIHSGIGQSYNPATSYTVDLSLCGLKEIPAYAFSHSGLSAIIFPPHIEVVGEHAFSSCGLNSNTMEIVIPASVYEIRSKAFSSMKQSTFVFENKSCLQTIGDSVFEGTAIKSGEIVLPYGVKSIGNTAFANCKGLERITLPSSVSSIGEDICERGSVYVNVEAGSYAALWASENGYMIQSNGTEDTSWLTAP